MPKSGTVRDLHQGLQQKAKLDEETKRNVRIFEARGNKVYKELLPDDPVVILSEFATLYAEKMPEEERDADRRDFVDCFHFEKEPNKPYGIPFKFLVKPVSDPHFRLFNRWAGIDEAQNESFKDTKSRLSKRVGIRGKQFDKIKFAIIQRSIYSKATYLTDGKHSSFTLTITFEVSGLQRLMQQYRRCPFGSHRQSG